MRNSARVSVRLRPGGRGDALLGFEAGVLRAQVSAPPLEGRANRALCKLIAKRAGVPPSRVSVLRGEKSRDKVVAVAGLDDEELGRRLAAADA
ncbi:MAG: DUF167 domain-containing protein [Actinobacteria bacterium]|nr:DUF167 domain-containing protein [Actinomycetota bacterium]